MAIDIARRRFTVDEYHRMGETGILDEDSNVELLEGVIYDMHPPKVHRWTVEDYHRLAEAGILGEDDRVELIDGEIVEMSPIGKRHQPCVDRLTALLVRGVGSSGPAAAIVRIQGSIQIDDHQEPQPDVALLKPRDDYYAGDLPRPSDVLLIIEVADTSIGYDRGEKRSLYSSAGIPEMWIVDLNSDTIEANAQPEAQAYRTSRKYMRGQSLDVPGIPGLSLRVDDILG